jgi:hypothetical protein
MSRIVRVLAFIFGALWFFPVSCTTGMFVAYPLVSKSYEYHMDKGDKPHSFFTVVWQPGAGNNPFGYSKLEALAPADKAAPERSYLMAQHAGQIEGVVAYKVLSSTTAEQLIEVAWTKDPYGSVSRYRATRTEVTPVFSKVTAPEFMIIALLYALGFAAALFAVGKLLRRQVASAAAKQIIAKLP